MLFFKRNKDGGLKSNTTAYWIFEIKSFASVGFLKFEGKSREVFHNHAFDCIGFVLYGKLSEDRLEKASRTFTWRNGFFPIYKDDYHKVSSDGTTWVFTIRGKWDMTWQEISKEKTITMTNGRKIIEEILN